MGHEVTIVNFTNKTIWALISASLLVNHTLQIPDPGNEFQLRFYCSMSEEYSQYTGDSNAGGEYANCEFI